MINSVHSDRTSDTMFRLLSLLTSASDCDDEYLPFIKENIMLQARRIHSDYYFSIMRLVVK